MKKIATLCVALSVLSSVVALAAPQTSKPAPKKPTKATVKLVDLWTCPMTGEAVKDHTVKASDPVVGKYRVHFCCAGCPESFAKLSAKEKQAKVAELAKKSTSTTTKKS